MRPISRYCCCGTLLARDNAVGLCSACQRVRRRDCAPDVPPEFWQTEAMATALDSGDLGRVVRAYRLHPFHGQPLPQATLAGWLHVSQATLSRIEQGRRRMRRRLAEAELDVVQVAVALLRRLDCSDDPLQAAEGVAEDDLDRLHALGGAARDRAATTDNLGELRTQPGLHAIEEPDGEGTAFAWREAQPRVGRDDGQLDAPADHLGVATSMRHHTSARRGQVVVRRTDAGLLATERAEMRRQLAHVDPKPHVAPFRSVVDRPVVIGVPMVARSARRNHRRRGSFGLLTESF